MKIKILLPAMLLIFCFSVNAQQTKPGVHEKKYTSKDIEALPANVLYVVNGNIVGTGKTFFEKIKPKAIKSMTKITEPSATSVYGTRGANGVILITTDEQKKK